jgi:hypothetical protein
MSQIFIHDFPGKQIQLQYLAPNEIETQLDLAKLALDQVFLLSENLFEPLSVDLWLTYCDPELNDYPLSEPTPPHPFWLLQHRNLPLGVEVTPAWEREIITVGDTLSQTPILDWIAVAFEQSCSGETEYSLGWQELLFRTTRARLPVQDMTGTTLCVSQGYGQIEYPVEHDKDSFWISGPRTNKTLTPPIDVRITNEAGLLTLELGLHWSLWTEPSEAGYFKVEQAIERLLAQAWRRLP